MNNISDNFININITAINNIIGSYLRSKTDFETAYHTYITKKTNIENIMKYTIDDAENDLIKPYKKYLDNQLISIKELYSEYNDKKSVIYNLKNEIKSNITILTDLLNETENNLQNKTIYTIFDVNDNIINNQTYNDDDVAGFEKTEYSSVYDNNFYWNGPFDILVPNNTDKVQSIYSNLYLTKNGDLLTRDDKLKENIFVYDKETYLENFAQNYNGQYVYKL
jgi:hypothetical protein